MNERTTPEPGRAALLINALARLGSRARHARDALRAHGLRVDRIVSVRSPSRMGRVVDGLLAEGFDRLVVGGGDGTIGAVASRLAGTDCLLGVLPLGTANDFARTLGIPRDLEAAAALAAGSSIRTVDVARADGASFLNVASMGMSVMLIGELSHGLKRWLGPAAYAVAGARVFLRHPTFQARIVTQAGAIECEVHQIVVANGRFFGGGVLVARDSSLDDGALFVYGLGARGRWQLLSTLTLLMLRIPLDRPGDFFFKTNAVRIETIPGLRVNLDGEIRAATPTTFEVVPGALRVLAPEAPGAGEGEPGRLAATAP